MFVFDDIRPLRDAAKGARIVAAGKDNWHGNRSRLVSRNGGTELLSTDGNRLLRTRLGAVQQDDLELSLSLDAVKLLSKLKLKDAPLTVTTSNRHVVLSCGERTVGKTDRIPPSEPGIRLDSYDRVLEKALEKCAASGEILRKAVLEKISSPFISNPVIPIEWCRLAVGPTGTAVWITEADDTGPTYDPELILTGDTWQTPSGNNEPIAVRLATKLFFSVFKALTSSTLVLHARARNEPVTFMSPEGRETMVLATSR